MSNSETNKIHLQHALDPEGPEDLYAQSGVNISAGNQAVQQMAQAVKSTYHSAVLSGIGGFGGVFDTTYFQTMKSPVLVASTDGVGTKVALGVEIDALEGLGQDIVHHSVNDILVQNARPLFFLDYVATECLVPEKIVRIVTGMAAACKQVNCALLGGETAEMPGTYRPGQLDIVGTMVGVAERERLLPKNTCLPGDVLIGLASSGPHTNGYSLLRKLCANVALDFQLPESNQTLKEALLAPHRCYLPVLSAALDAPEQPIKALAHITGGGFVENIPRILPEECHATIYSDRWPTPPLFKWIQTKFTKSFQDLWRILNMGIGMVMVVAPHHVKQIKTLINEPCWEIGFLRKGSRGISCDVS